MAFVRSILLGYGKYRVNPLHALERAQILPSQVGRDAARISAEQMEIISATAMQELDDEALGWFSRRLPWGTYGLLCRASRGAPSLRVALKRWCRHHALLTDDIVLHVDGARLWIEERRLNPQMRELCLLASLRYVVGYACWLVDSQLPLVQVTFPFAEPTHARVYPLLFAGPVRFGSEVAALELDPRYLDLTPKRDEAALDQMLQRALPLTVRQYRRDRLLVERVRASLRRDGALDATRVAAELHTSVRSLHRQLAAEGASLQSIKDRVRRERATELLRRGEAVKQVARAVGFASEKSFARAFKEWTGRSPSTVRQRA